MTAAASPCHLCRAHDPARAEPDGGLDSMQRSVLTTAREQVPVKRALPPRRTLHSDRSPRGDEQPGAHEPRRKTSPRLTHPKPLPGGPKPVDVASPVVTPRNRARRPPQPPTMLRSRRLTLQRRSAMLARVSPRHHQPKLASPDRVRKLSKLGIRTHRTQGLAALPPPRRRPDMRATSHLHEEGPS
jgi:hypothetical protein